MVNLVATYESKMPKESLLSSICRDCTVPSVPSAKLRLVRLRRRERRRSPRTRDAEIRYSGLMQCCVLVDLLAKDLVTWSRRGGGKRRKMPPGPGLGTGAGRQTRTGGRQQ